MSEHPQVARRRAYLEAFAQGDLSTVRDYFSDDVVWHVAGKHPLSGDYRGKDALIAYFERVREMTGGSLTFEATGILGNDDHVATFLRVRGQRDDRTLDVEMADMLRVGPDGRWTEFWSMPDDQDAVDAFWS
jgi:hypothetical protein